MKLWKRLAVFSLAITATFFCLFWVTAFTTEEVSRMEHGDASFVTSIKVNPATFSKSSTIMKRSEVA